MPMASKVVSGFLRHVAHPHSVTKANAVPQEAIRLLDTLDKDLRLFGRVVTSVVSVCHGAYVRCPVSPQH